MGLCFPNIFDQCEWPHLVPAYLSANRIHIYKIVSRANWTMQTVIAGKIKLGFSIPDSYARRTANAAFNRDIIA